MNELDIELYDILSDKTYSEWCLIKIIDKININEVTYTKVWFDLVFYAEANYELSERDIEKWDEFYYSEIIWHEPTIQDIFIKCDEWCWNWVANSNNWISFSEWDCNIWNGIEYDFTKSLLKQTDSVKRIIIHYFYQPNISKK